MRQHLDITDVEARTKIRAKYLRALENEDFGMLPGSTFVKSFLRTYAELLGLDPHLLVEEYRVRHDPRDESELTPFASSGAPRGRERRPPPRNRVPWLGGVLAVMAILGLLLILGLTGGSSDNGGKKTPATSTHASKAKTKPTAKRHRRRHHTRVPRSVRLRVAPAGATYVCLDSGAGTKVLFEGTLSGPRSFRGRHLRINLGRRNVTLTANGKRVRVPPGSDPIGFDFRPRKGRTIPAGQRRPCG